MGRGRPRKPIVLSGQVREELNSLSTSRTLSHGLVRRAKIVLMSVEGLSNRVIAQKVGLSQQSVITWRNRFLQQGLMGLYDERRSGRPRTVEAEDITALIRKTLTKNPKTAAPIGRVVPSLPKRRYPNPRCNVSGPHWGLRHTVRSTSSYLTIPSSQKKSTTSSVCIWTHRILR